MGGALVGGAQIPSLVHCCACVYTPVIICCLSCRDHEILLHFHLKLLRPTSTPSPGLVLLQLLLITTEVCFLELLT